MITPLSSFLLLIKLVSIGGATEASEIEQHVAKDEGRRGRKLA